MCSPIWKSQVKEASDVVYLQFYVGCLGDCGRLGCGVAFRCVTYLMSVGYTCPGLNRDRTACEIHWSVPVDGVKCRVQGEGRRPVVNSRSEVGQAPAGAANIVNRVVRK